MTQKTLIKKYLESLYPDWIKEFEIYRINTPAGFIGPRGCRDCRELLADGEIEGELRGKYRWIRANSVAKVEGEVKTSLPTSLNIGKIPPEPRQEFIKVPIAGTIQDRKSNYRTNYRPEFLKRESQKSLL
jgi:hypothetical protein